MMFPAMKFLVRSAFLALVLCAADGRAQGTAQETDQEMAAGDLRVVEPWARAGAAMAQAGAAFLVIRNTGSQPDRLTAAASEIAARAELHTHIMDNGVMRMRPVAAIDLPPGAETALRPGGLHVMFLGLKRPLKEGDRFPLVLTFERAGTVTVEVPVLAAGAMAPGGTQGGDHGGGHMRH